MRCSKCVMTNTRPNIKFDKEGVCNPCRNFELRSKIDWGERWVQLEALCNKYRKNDGSYDCVIALSGGKDSHYQVYLFKEIFKMNPLGIMIDNFSWTKTGRDNFNNISEAFGLDIITFTPDRRKMKAITRKGFLEDCYPNKYWDSILYKKPLELARKMGLELVIWGENPSFEVGGVNRKETKDARCLTEDKFDDLEVIFTSYYVPWSRFNNIVVAKQYGFKGLDDTGEWKRWGMEDFEYEQIDTWGYLVNQYCKFIKFGFGTITELCSDAVRHGVMTREEALERVNEDDFKLDYDMEKDFRDGIGITAKAFWEVIDNNVNMDLLGKRVNGNWWRLKNDAI